MSENKCPDCNHSDWYDDDDACMLCARFKHDSTCFACHRKITSIKDHTCNQCGYTKCDCDGCPSPIKEKKIIPITYEVQVVIHEDVSSCWDIHDSLEDAIKGWDFGRARAGAHHWDQNVCHVAQDPTTGKWALLYL